MQLPGLIMQEPRNEFRMRSQIDELLVQEPGCNFGSSFNLPGVLIGFVDLALATLTKDLAQVWGKLQEDVAEAQGSTAAYDETLDVICESENCLYGSSWSDLGCISLYIHYAYRQMHTHTHHREPLTGHFCRICSRRFVQN